MFSFSQTVPPGARVVGPAIEADDLALAKVGQVRVNERLSNGAHRLRCCRFGSTPDISFIYQLAMAQAGTGFMWWTWVEEGVELYWVYMFWMVGGGR